MYEGDFITSAELRKLPLLCALSDAERAAVLDKCDTRQFRARTQSLVEIDFHQRVLIVLRGGLRVLAISPTGASSTLYNLVAGDVMGVSRAMTPGALHLRGERVCFEQDTILLTIKNADFCKLVDAIPALAASALRAVCATQAELASRFYEATTLDVRGRLIAELARISSRGERVDGGLIVNEAPSHGELGDQISAAREAVTRQLKQLEREGVVEVRRRKLVIRDEARLRALDEKHAGHRVAAEPGV